MTKLILSLDHDVHLYFVAALRHHGYEAHSAQEHGNQEASDEDQLLFATNRGWTLLSYNIDDFSTLHRLWIAQGKGHVGILLASQFNPALTLRRLFNVLFLADPQELQNCCLFLGSRLDV
jgi:hypothetical protein